MNARTCSRREVAKRLGITTAALRDLETSGVAVPMRDEKRRYRYSAEAIEALRAVVAPTMPPQPMSMAAPVPDQYFAPPPPPQQQSFEQYIPSAPPEQASRPPLTPDEQATFQDEFAYTLAAEATRFGATTAELLQAWQRANLPIELPQSFVPMLSDWSPRFGMGIEEMWQTLLAYLPSVPMSAPQAYVPQRPVYATPTPSSGYSMAAVQPQHPVPFPYTPPPQVRPRYTAPTRAPGYYPMQQWGPSAFMPTPFQVAQQQPDPVRDARNLFEVQKIELERRRMDRGAADEEEARRKAEEREAARDVNLQHAQALAVAHAQAEAQQRDKLASLQWEEHQRQIAAQAEQQRHHAELEQRQRAEVEQVERTVAQVVAQLPAYIPYDAVEAIRQSIWASVAGKPAGVVAVIAQDIAARAVAPFQVQQQTLAVRQQIAAAVTSYERLSYASLGGEAAAAAESAVRAFVESGAADGLDPYTASNEARRVRDAALGPYRNAAEEQNKAQQVENVIMMKMFAARSRAQELLRAAGVDDYSAIETAVARAVELTRSRASQLNPAAGMYQFNEQIGELLMAAVEEAVAEVAS